MPLLHLVPEPHQHLCRMRVQEALLRRRHILLFPHPLQLLLEAF